MNLAEQVRDKRLQVNQMVIEDRLMQVIFSGGTNPRSINDGYFSITGVLNTPATNESSEIIVESLRAMSEEILKVACYFERQFCMETN